MAAIEVHRVDIARVTYVFQGISSKDDEVGALNTLGPNDVKAALGLVKEGKVYDMGVTYDRTSFKWPGHSPGEILTFRSHEGVKRQKDLPFTQGEGNAMACGACHLMNGEGHPESGTISGFTADYLVQQMTDFTNGASYSTWSPDASRLVASTIDDSHPVLLMVDANRRASDQHAERLAPVPEAPPPAQQRGFRVNSWSPSPRRRRADRNEPGAA